MSRTCWRCCAGREPARRVAAFRALQLLPGMGPAIARRVLRPIGSGACGRVLGSDFYHRPPLPVLARPLPRSIARLAMRIRRGKDRLGCARLVSATARAPLRPWASRVGDLDQLEQIACGYRQPRAFFDRTDTRPPDASGADAGRPLLDEDYLILSTIHSAKGQEWDTVLSSISSTAACPRKWPPADPSRSTRSAGYSTWR